MSTIIQMPANVLDENCATCNALDLTKVDMYTGPDTVVTEFRCSNLHLCQYIRNRIVRKEKENRKTLWVLQCRNDDMEHAMLLYYATEKEAKIDEEVYKKKYQYVALEEAPIFEKENGSDK